MTDAIYQPDLFAAPSGTVGADVVCGVCLGPWYPSDQPARFCNRPAAWKWTHPIIKARGEPSPFDKIVTDYYCQAHGDRTKEDFAGVGKWEHIADNARLDRPEGATETP